MGGHFLVTGKGKSRPSSFQESGDRVQPRPAVGAATSSTSCDRPGLVAVSTESTRTSRHVPGAKCTGVPREAVHMGVMGFVFRV